MFRHGVLLVLLTRTVAQNPHEGLGKNTFASSKPFTGLAWMLKYLPLTAAEDSCDGNYCTTGPTGVTIQGRGQLIKYNYALDYNCALFSTAGSPVTKGSDSTAIVAPASLGADCTYTTGDAYDAGSSTLMHSVYGHTADQCCKACAATSGCAAATYTGSSTMVESEEAAGERQVGAPVDYEGFGLHLTDVTPAVTTGGLSVGDLEAAFVTNLDGLKAFVPFMDHSTQLFAANLSFYAEQFARGGEPTYTASWDAGDGTTWYSIFAHVPESTMLLELVGHSPPTKAAALGALPTIERRISPRNIKLLANTVPTSSHNILYAVSVSRAVSNITAIEHFYEQIAKATLVDSTDGSVKRRCYQWFTALSDVCFIQRDGADSVGALSVAGLEAMLWAVHASVIGSDPENGDADKYTDSHYAITLPSASGDYLSTYWDSVDPFPITKATREAYACKQSYLIDPTGFSIQMGLTFTGAYPGCTPI
jgi:hypothetical protein